MEQVHKNGLMAQNMKDTGRKTKQTDKVNLFMLTAMFMKANGSMIKLMEKVLTPTPMVLITMATGLMISSTAMVWKAGPMVPSMKETTSMERRKEKVN